MYHHKNDDDEDNQEERNDNSSSWDSDFLKIDQGSLFELVLVRSFFNQNFYLLYW